jgi:hypothetical protein
MRRLAAIPIVWALAASTAALAQGGQPPSGALPSTVTPGTAAGVNNSVSPAPTTLSPADPAAVITGKVGEDASTAATHPPGAARGTASTAPAVGADAGLRGRQAGALTDLGSPPASYPVCRNRSEDRCRVR